MLNFLLSGEILKISVLYTICFLLIFTLAWGQETTPKLELEEEEYQIIGKDTRVFSIIGDRKSTVEFIPVPLILTEEKRNIESPEGLIGESERLHRRKSFTTAEGFYSYLDYSFGAHTMNNLFSKAILDTGNFAAAVKLKNRSANENTPYNMAPLSQGIEIVSYYDASFADFSVNFGFSREDDDALGSKFRPGNREVNRYRAGITVKSLKSGKWDLDGRFLIKGGTFKNFEILNDKDELILDGGISASCDIYDISVIVNSSVKYIELSKQNGSIFTVGATGKWLFMDILGIKTGAVFYAFDKPDLPDKGTTTKAYPILSIDLAITPRSFARLNYKPGITTHSFSDIYDYNGLASITTPMLFEDRNVDFDGEFGIRTGSGFSTSIGAFFVKTRQSPVFSRSGNFFEVVKDAGIDLSGYRLKSEYNSNDIWGLDGIINTNKASWNSGDVPYIPNIEVCLNGYYSFFSSWKLRASLQFYGKHHVDINSDDVENSFFTIDMGVDRKLWKQHLSMYFDLRNITNSKGSWWTNKYKIPGIGLYLGIKAHY